MTPKLNNVEDGYFHNIYLLNSTQDAYDEIRTLIASGGGGSGGGGSNSGLAINQVLGPLNLNSSGVLSLNATTSLVLLATDNNSAQTVTTTSNGAVFVNGSELVHLYYLQNTYAPSLLKLTASNNIVRNLEPQLDGSLEWNSQTIILEPSLTQILTSYITQQSLNTTLGSYQALLTPGTGTSISNNVISVTGSSGGGGGGGTLTLQINGVTQSATTLDFVDNSAVLVNGVLDVSRLTNYDKILLFHANANDKKDLKQTSYGKLEFDSIEMANDVNDLGNFAFSLLRLTDATNITRHLTPQLDLSLEWGGNTLITDTSLTGILNSYITQQSLTSTLTSYQPLLTTGTGLSISNNVISPVPDNFDFTSLELRDSPNNMKNLTSDNLGKLLYNNSNLATEAYVTSQLSSTAVSATLPLQITSNTIETLFKPSTVSSANSLLLTSSDTLGTLHISPVPDNFEITTLKLKDSGNTVRNPTTSVAGDLMFDGTLNITSSLAVKQDSLSVQVPLQLSANTLSSLLKPSTVSSANSLILTSSDTLGTLHISPIPNNFEFTDLKINNANNVNHSLTHDANHNLLWDGNEVQLVQDSFTQITAALPLSISSSSVGGGTGLNVFTLFKPSTVSGVNSLLFLYKCKSIAYHPSSKQL